MTDRDPTGAGDAAPGAGSLALRGMIAAVSPEGVIGVSNRIPWKYPGDVRRFKRVTLGSTVLMGRRTWESAGKRALPGRRNIVITRQELHAPGIECFPDLRSALDSVPTDVPVWFLGGTRIYEEAMRYCDIIDLTYIPDSVGPVAEGIEVARFPDIDPALWEPGPLLPHEDDPSLRRRVFTRRRS